MAAKYGGQGVCIQGLFFRLRDYIILTSKIIWFLSYWPLEYMTQSLYYLFLYLTVTFKTVITLHSFVINLHSDFFTFFLSFSFFMYFSSSILSFFLISFFVFLRLDTKPTPIHTKTLQTHVVCGLMLTGI